MTSPGESVEWLVVPARGPAPARRFLPEPADMVAVARIAQGFTSRATITYRYEGERRELRVFPGGWWERPVRP